MTEDERIEYLIDALLEEMREYRAEAGRIPRVRGERRRLLRALMNVRPSLPLSPEFLEVQDALLSAEQEAKGIVDVRLLPAVSSDPRLCLWQGDITRLNNMKSPQAAPRSQRATTSPAVMSCTPWAPSWRARSWHGIARSCPRAIAPVSRWRWRGV